MCSRLTVKSKSSGNSHTRTHARTHPRTRQYTNTTHTTLSDGTPRRSRTLARTLRIGGVHANHDGERRRRRRRRFAGSGRVGARPGTGRGTRAHTHTHTLARDGRTRARARDRARAAAAAASTLYLGSRLRVYGERPVTRPAIGRRFRAPPDGTRRARPMAARVTGHTGRDDNLTNNA